MQPGPRLMLPGPEMLPGPGASDPLCLLRDRARGTRCGTHLRTISWF